MGSRLSANLQRYGPLPVEGRAAVESLIIGSRIVVAGDDIVVEDDPATHCRILLEGQAFRHRTLPDGRRQITAFHIRGDVVDLQGLFLSIDRSVTALTVCEVGLIPHGRLAELMANHPAVARAFWRSSLADGAALREWMLGMGRRSAYARIAHLFCEMIVRLRSAGLEQQDRFPFPITQQHLSDALGLSAVHTNRTLQTLRREGLISFQHGELMVLDWAGLAAAGEFDAGYLHLPEHAPT